jgi:hypothetical protein
MKVPEMLVLHLWSFDIVTKGDAAPFGAHGKLRKDFSAGWGRRPKPPKFRTDAWNSSKNCRQ